MSEKDPIPAYLADIFTPDVVKALKSPDRDDGLGISDVQLRPTLEDTKEAEQLRENIRSSLLKTIQETPPPEYPHLRERVNRCFLEALEDARQKKESRQGEHER